MKCLLFEGFLNRDSSIDDMEIEEEGRKACPMSGDYGEKKEVRDNRSTCLQAYGWLHFAW